MKAYEKYQEEATGTDPPKLNRLASQYAYCIRLAAVCALVVLPVCCLDGFTLTGCEEEIFRQPVLFGVELKIAAMLRVQRFMRAALDYVSGFDDEYLIRAPNGRQPVRNHKRRAASHQISKPFLDQGLGFGIEA